MARILPLKPAEVMDLTRTEVIEHLLDFPGTFKFDFTREYLETLTDEELKHVLMAAYCCVYQVGR